MNRIKLTKLISLLFLAIALIGFHSCEEDIADEHMYTFKKKTMGQYIEEEPTLSDFATILQRSTTMGLLKAYGQFTCFVPDNAAMKAYYQKKGKTSLDDFTDEELKVIAHDHIISGDTVTSAHFGEGRLTQMTMSDKFLSITYSETDIFVNVSSKILQKDVSVHNGVVHVISETIDPTRFGLVEVILADEKFTLFSEALLATGLADSLQRDIDESYDPNKHTDLIKVLDRNWRWDDIPWLKRWGYTALMESNETYAKHGINNLDDLKAYAASVYDKVYPNDKDITNLTDRKNSLNRFVAYHLITKELSTNKFINAYDNTNQVKLYDLYEYIETLCPNTLIEVKKDRKMAESNLFNYMTQTGRVIRLTDYVDKEAQNGIYHEIDGILVYDEQVYAEQSSKRLRLNCATFFDEFTNNGFRGAKSARPLIHMQFPRNYLERLETSAATTMGYVYTHEALMNFQGDELFMDVRSGNLYDFSILLPPVPAGNYEVRFGYLTNYYRGVCQFYFDGVPTGVPVNLNNDGSHESIGWVRPGSQTDDPDGYENDKMMRNQGFMKAPACICAPEMSSSSARYDRRVLRKILGIYEFKEDGHHVLGVKGLSGGQFELDYVEFVPTSAIESEDVF